jgi:hypothetical protein
MALRRQQLRSIKSQHGAIRSSIERSFRQSLENRA